MTQPNNKKLSDRLREAQQDTTPMSMHKASCLIIELSERLEAAEAAVHSLRSLTADQQEQINKLSEPKCLKQALIDAEQIASYMKPDIRNYAGFEPWKPEEDGRPSEQPSSVAVRSAIEDGITFSADEWRHQAAELEQRGFERAIELLQQEPVYLDSDLPDVAKGWYKGGIKWAIDVLRAHQEKGSK